MEGNQNIYPIDLGELSRHYDSLPPVIKLDDMIKFAEFDLSNRIENLSLSLEKILIVDENKKEYIIPPSEEIIREFYRKARPTDSDKYIFDGNNLYIIKRYSGGNFKADKIEINKISLTLNYKNKDIHIERKIELYRKNNFLEYIIKIKGNNQNENNIIDYEIKLNKGQTLFYSPSYISIIPEYFTLNLKGNTTKLLFILLTFKENFINSLYLGKFTDGNFQISPQPPDSQLFSQTFSPLIAMYYNRPYKLLLIYLPDNDGLNQPNKFKYDENTKEFTYDISIQ